VTPSARAAAIRLAQETLALRPVYLDTETTGLDPAAEIVEICVLDHAGRALVNSLVRPKARISAAAARVHGIGPDTVRDAPAWPEVWPQVAAALTGRRVAIYNAEFDARMMRQSHRAHRLDWQWDEGQFFCIMLLYAQFRGEWSAYHGSYRRHKLEEAGRQCSLRLPNAHRAEADARLARAVLHCVAGPRR